MKLTKQDLMRLPKERLAEIIVEMMEEMEENQVYKHEGPTIPAFWPPCHYGGECTNPFRDCINCPQYSIVGINTSTGTSTAKMEGKDGND